MGAFLVLVTLVCGNNNFTKTMGRNSIEKALITFARGKRNERKQAGINLLIESK
jgi:hypothetical protein